MEVSKWTRSKWTRDAECVVSRADARAWALQQIMSVARGRPGLVSMVSDVVGGGPALAEQGWDW